MSVIAKLAALGIHIGEDVSDDIAKKLLEKVTEAQNNGKFGKIIHKFNSENPDFGKILIADKPSTSLKEMREASDQAMAINKERYWLKAQEAKAKKLNTPARDEVMEARAQADAMRNEGFTADVPASPSPKPQTLKEMMQDLKKIKEEKELTNFAKKSAAGMLVAPQASVDMSPLPYLKKGYEAYKGLKDRVFGAAADQMDLTKDKSATEGLKTGMDLALDPLNYIPGGVGMAIGGLQTGLEMLPNEEDPNKKNKFEKVKALINRNPSGDLP
jgi:hypothetical protein